MTIAPTSSIVQAHFAASVAATERFFAADAWRVAEGCRQMAERFATGATLYVVGEGAQASDAHHVAVEFVHPIIVGKRALPAIALTSDMGVFTAHAEPHDDGAFVRSLKALARPNDILLALCAHAAPPSVEAAIRDARARGMLTIAVGGRPLPEIAADMAFVVADENPLIVQEVTETLYHVLWELVHVFLDAHEPQVSAFLAAERSVARGEDLTAQVVASIRRKADDIVAIRKAIAERFERPILDAAGQVASRVREGGRILSFGNGGSATDAQDVTADAMAPPIPGWRPVPALALTNDVGVLTAIGNDVGFEHVFVRQIAAFAAPCDVALAFSTSGASRNLLAALAAAKARGLMTVAMSGSGGGPLAGSRDVDFCFTAPSDHLPRIQEAHATTWHALLCAMQEALR